LRASALVMLKAIIRQPQYMGIVLRSANRAMGLHLQKDGAPCKKKEGKEERAYGVRLIAGGRPRPPAFTSPGFPCLFEERLSG
jgi:hypothetical protein